MSEKPAYKELEQRVRELEKAESKRKQAEKALQESEQKFRSIFDNLPMGIHMYQLDPDGQLRFISANPAANEILGVDNTQYLGKTIDEAFPEIHKTEIPGRFKIIAEKGGFWKKEEIVYKDKKIEGAFENFNFQISPGRMVSLFLETTERKQAEEAFRKSGERYALATSAAKVGVWDWNIKTGDFYLDPNIKAILGYTDDEIPNDLEVWVKYVHPEDSKAVMEAAQACLDGKTSEYIFEHRMLHKDGSNRWILVRGKAIRDESGNAVRLIGTDADITDRKQMEEALCKIEEKIIRSNKMESMGLLAGGVAHDLNNILSGLVAYPDLLLMNLPPDSKHREYIEKIRESGLRAAAVVRDLLTVARGVAINKEPLNLNDIVEDYLLSPEHDKLKQFHPTAAIEAKLEAGLFNINGSKAHLRKVIMNLVSNAAEALDGSGNVVISTMNRYVDRPISGYSDVNEGEYAVWSVSDDGPGISPNDLNRIFEPFYTKKIMGRSGTGLGLAVVWNVVQDHKGYIDVISDENGTTFDLYFPITREEIQGKDLFIPIKDYKGNGETILIVDDVESQVEIASELLNTLGYKAKGVSSGEEAIEYMKENTVDLVLLDMIMDPGINGRETYEKIIKNHPNQKAIIVSGFAETEEVKEAQKLGAGQYIKKPITLGRLGLAVKEELEK